jgi:hypothetical protein
MPPVTSKVPGNGSNTLSWTVPGDGMDVETVYASVDATGAGGAVTAEVTVADQSGVVIARKTQGSTIAAGGTGSATWALRLDDEGGASTPATPVVEQYDVYTTGGNLLLTPGSFGSLVWSYNQGSQSPIPILNMTNPAAPTMPAGLYFIELQILPTTALNANKTFALETKISSIPNYLTDQGSVPVPAGYTTPNGDFQGITYSFAWRVRSAGAAIELFVGNGDTVNRSFYISHVNLIQLTGLTVN